MDYLYDGSFDGLLTAIYHSYYGEKAEGIYPVNAYQYNLITQSKIVSTNPAQAAKVYTAAEKKISSDFLEQAYYVFLSDILNRENLILRYFQSGFRLGAQIDSYHTHPDVLPVHQIARKVTFEVHRFLGLLRFAEHNHYLYAALEPDHNILILLADHFVDRMSGENFIIHDKRRSMAIIHNQHKWYLTDFTEDLSQANFESESEEVYQSLWTKYFTHIGISDRKNKRLQANFVPQRYRHNLVEFRRSVFSD